MELHCETCLAYLDDIIVFVSFKQNLERLEDVFSRLTKGRQESGLKLHPRKSFQTLVSYLGPGLVSPQILPKSNLYRNGLLPNPLHKCEVSVIYRYCPTTVHIH